MAGAGVLWNYTIVCRVIDMGTLCACIESAQSSKGHNICESTSIDTANQCTINTVIVPFTIRSCKNNESVEFVNWF